MGYVNLSYCIGKTPKQVYGPKNFFGPVIPSMIFHQRGNFHNCDKFSLHKRVFINFKIFHHWFSFYKLMIFHYCFKFSSAWKISITLMTFHSINKFSSDWSTQRNFHHINESSSNWSILFKQNSMKPTIFLKS